jgi:DNA-binding response OmpR family regulator
MPALHLVISDKALCSAVTEQLVLHGYEGVHETADIAEALEDVNAAAIIIDDAALDKKTLKAINEAGPKKKRVFLLGEIKNDGETSVTESFPKPLRLGHLLARLQFYLNAGSRLREASFQFGPYKFEPQNRQLLSEGSEPIRLTEKETALLDYLGQSSDPVGREELLAAIWGYDGRIDTHTLETHMYQLRRKLDPNGSGENWLINEDGAYHIRRTDGEKK